MLQYVFIGFILGLIIGLIIMRYGNKTIRNQNKIKKNLEESKEEFIEYKKEIKDHLFKSMELLEKLTSDYHNLYNHIYKGYKFFIYKKSKKNYIKNENEFFFEKTQPRDYPIKNDKIILNKIKK
ncbi:yhcB [Wigglesworthia glossinidia endosymbiont of Glossina brevipalpis]|uniref:Z-ring associated protein G n=1 Tax=Wigglesworthia glossinidia brevipalpis TaxID=36870 RepID=Q8D359_WIGBR|nr:yhcB [Wigglesworthia glossinidia endosymbiont of Glossina brevipalpis]